MEDIAAVLDGPADGGRSCSEAVQGHIGALERRIQQMEAAREHLQHVLSYHRDAPPDGCEHCETLIWGCEPPSGHQR